MVISIVTSASYEGLSQKLLGFVELATEKAVLAAKKQDKTAENTC